MKRLLRISLDTLLMSTLPIIMWVLLGIVVNKNVTNVFTLTYPIQFITTLLVSIFGSGANINATKSNRNNFYLHIRYCYSYDYNFNEPCCCTSIILMYSSLGYGKNN